MYIVNALIEVVIICEYNDLILTTLKVMAPNLEFLNDSYKLLIENLISSYYRNDLSSKKGHRESFIKFAGLRRL